METKTYLSRYLITLDQYGQPIKVRRSGNATTYKAFDATSNREVALELIPAGSVRLSVQSKLEAEAEAAKHLKQINIPMLYDFGIEDNELIYAMEMVDGVTAEDWVKTHGPMPLGSALRIASQIVNALGAATFHGIFHHALNPGNIMIVPGQTAEGEWPLIKVMKFIGLAPSYSAAQASEAGVADAINFVAPEQLETGSADFRSEVYALGATLWFLLSGVPPLAGAATVENASRVPAPVRSLLVQMLAIDPRDRPFDPVALHAAIEDCIAEVENKRVVAPPPKKVVAPAAAIPVPVATAAIDPRPRKPFPWQPIAVAAVLLAFAGVAASILPKVFRSGTASRDAIGVPIGVPEPAATAAASTVARNAPAAPAATRSGTAAPAIAATAAPINTASNTQIAAASPGVLTSTAAPDDDADDADADAADAEDGAAPSAPSRASEQQSARVASNTAATAPQPRQSASAAPRDEPGTPLFASAPAPSAPPQPQSSASTLPQQQPGAPLFASAPSPAPAAAQQAEPAPPAEGPDEQNTAAPSTEDAPALYANVSPDGNAPATEAVTQPTRSSSRDASRSEPSRKQTKSKEKTKAVAKGEKRAAKKERIAAANPPLPEGSVRAQFLGTTPEGELVFGLPSDERGYVAPTGSSKRERRRARREAVLPAEPADELPVLPALPADE